MSRRLPVLVILLGVVLGALVIDRADDGTDETVTSDAGVLDDSVLPVASDPAALSSTWFCAGGTGDEESFADHVVEIVNPTERPVTVTLTVFGGNVAPPLTTVEPEDLDEPAEDDGDEGAADDGGEDAADDGAEDDAAAEPAPTPEPVEHAVELGPRDHASVRLAEVLAAPVVSALVEAPAGGIVVEHRVTSIHGEDVKPCATSAASTWHFAYGDTTVDARELLVLFNPFPDDAIVDGRFSTEDGVRQPERFDGLVVPGRGTLAVDLGDDVTRREEVAATITSRNGRIVVDRIQRVDGESERGLTVQLGVPTPQRAWVFPDGLTSDTIREEYVVYNPGEEVAEVEIELIVDEPEVNGIPESVDLSLPPGAHQVFDLNADGRVPPRVAHTGVVRSANGVPVVAERVLFVDGATRKGIAVTTGSPVEAERWTFAAGAATESIDEWLVLVNLDPEILAEVRLEAVVGGRLVEVSELQDLEVLGGQRLAIRVGEHISGREQLPLVVTSTEPIVVERAIYRVAEEERGISNAIGVPAPAGMRLPPDPFAAEAPADLGDAPTDDGDGEGEGDAGDGSGDGDDVPEAPDDVELPEPDETIEFDDPDAPAQEPDGGAEEPDGSEEPDSSVP